MKTVLIETPIPSPAELVWEVFSDVRHSDHEESPMSTTTLATGSHAGHGSAPAPTASYRIDAPGTTVAVISPAAPGRCRMFFDFSVDDHVRTAAFTVDIDDAATPMPAVGHHHTDGESD